MMGLLCERRNSDTNPSQKKKQPSGVALPSSYSNNAPLTTKVAAILSSANCMIPVTDIDAVKDSRKLSQLSQQRGVSMESDDYVYSEKRVKIHNGRYEYYDSPKAFLGHGSYGTVFKGLDHRHNEVVAIKKMSSLNVKPDELKAMKRVRNSHLVSMIDVCDEGNDLTYVIMELCNTDLDRHLHSTAQEGRLNSDDLRTVVESIARGYFALYEKHIVHRDIKPQNILLQYYGGTKTIATAKITDFGVSRVLADEGNNLLCNVAGTLLYMAPEVGANLLTMCEYDYSADIWSIGCVVYQCHTGKLPFDENSLCRLFLHCAGGNYDAYEMPELPEDTDHRLHLLLSSLLEIDREKRATPRQFYNAVIMHSEGGSGSGGSSSLKSSSPSTTSIASSTSSSSSFCSSSLIQQQEQQQLKTEEPSKTT